MSSAPLWVLRACYIRALGLGIMLMFFPTDFVAHFEISEAEKLGLLSSVGQVPFFWSGMGSVVAAFLFMAAAQGTLSEQRKALQYGVIPQGLIVMYDAFSKVVLAPTATMPNVMFVSGAVIVLSGIIAAYGQLDSNNGEDKIEVSKIGGHNLRKRK